MPKQSSSAPFVPVDDPPEITNDPVNRRVVAMFDALRRRQVGPDKAAFVVSQIFARSAGEGSHPTPTGQ